MKRTPFEIYCHFIEDGLGVISRNIAKHEILTTLTGWHSSIELLTKDVEMSDAVHYLDLSLYFNKDRNKILYQSDWKLSKTYDYLSVNSAHHPICWRNYLSNTPSPPLHAKLHIDDSSAATCTFLFCFLCCPHLGLRAFRSNIEQMGEGGVAK